jgi:hypothetical protein
MSGDILIGNERSQITQEQKDISRLAHILTKVMLTCMRDNDSQEFCDDINKLEEIRESYK